MQQKHLVKPLKLPPPQIEEGRFAELSNSLVLPPVDDLRQAAFFLPYALLRTNADSALAAKARRMQQSAPPCPHPVHICVWAPSLGGSVYQPPTCSAADTAFQDRPCMICIDPSKAVPRICMSLDGPACCHCHNTARQAAHGIELCRKHTTSCWRG